MRILYVEDENLLAEAVKHILENNGFSVDRAADGEKFGTAQMPLIFRLKKNTLSGILSNASNLVAPGGLEPSTQGSSGLCSTN